MKTYFDCWAEVAAALFSQALAGEPELAESLPKPLGAGSFGWAATLAGDVEGRFAVLLDGAILETPLMGEGVDQKAGWKELLRETFDAAAGEMLARNRQEVPGGEALRRSRSRARSRAPFSCAPAIARGRFWCGMSSRVARSAAAAAKPAPATGDRASSPTPASSAADRRRLDLASPGPRAAARCRTGGLAALRRARDAARRDPRSGPGDVVELDRHVADPVDLIVGDKIVARGEVVLVNGNFGLRVTEVAAPRKRLESVRCLF